MRLRDLFAEIQLESILNQSVMWTLRMRLRDLFVETQLESLVLNQSVDTKGEVAWSIWGYSGDSIRVSNWTECEHLLRMRLRDLFADIQLEYLLSQSVNTKDKEVAWFYLQDIVATPERPLLTDLPSPDYSYNGAISNNIYHEIPDDLQPIHRPIQLAVAGNTAGIQSCNTSSSSSGYGSVLRYDNVRGDSRGPFISYPVLEDRPLQPLALSRPNNLALEKQAHDSPLIWSDLWYVLLVNCFAFANHAFLPKIHTFICIGLLRLKKKTIVSIWIFPTNRNK